MSGCRLGRAGEAGGERIGKAAGLRIVTFGDEGRLRDLEQDIPDEWDRLFVLLRSPTSRGASSRITENEEVCSLLLENSLSCRLPPSVSFVRLIRGRTLRLGGPNFNFSATCLGSDGCSSRGRSLTDACDLPADLEFVFLLLSGWLT